MNLSAENIRKAAILIASVDCPTADALLDQMSDQQAACVRQAVIELTDVELAEAEPILTEFLRRRAAAGHASSMPADPNPALTRSSSAAPGQSIACPPAPPTLKPVARLDGIQLPTLARRLARERPRMIAVVAIQLAPRRAAELLKHLPDDLQADVLRCIACQQPTDEALLREIEQQLGDELQAGLLEPADSPQGVSAVQAILDQVDAAHRTRIASRLADGDQHLVRQLDLRVEREVSTAQDMDRNGDRERNQTALISHRPRGRDGLDDEQTASHVADHEAVAFPSDVDFEDLNQLDDRSLARVFREADWPTLILALTAAPAELIERLARQLSPRAAQMLRHRVEHPGLLRLRDIEIAQQEIAFLIADLAARGLIRLPHRRGFTIAA